MLLHLRILLNNNRKHFFNLILHLRHLLLHHNKHLLLFVLSFLLGNYSFFDVWHTILRLLVLRIFHSWLILVPCILHNFVGSWRACRILLHILTPISNCVLSMREIRFPWHNPLNNRRLLVHLLNALHIAIYDHWLWVICIQLLVYRGYWMLLP